MDLGIAGKRALVCAASRGLGRGCALVFPGIVGAGVPGGVAAGVIFVATRKTGNVLLALFLGVGTVAALRGAGL